MLFKFSKEIYNKEAIIKAAYNYTDQASLHLDADEVSYIVSIKMRENGIGVTEAEFQNEVLAQMVRQCVQSKTKTIRELILARAFSSSLICDTPDYEVSDKEPDIDDILTDWFEKYE